MRVLIACEFSGAVRRAFRERGHDAWSCDLLPAEDGSPYHIQAEHDLHLLDIVRNGWGLMIAHPPCRYLSNSGACRLYVGGKGSRIKDPERWENMRRGALLFRALWNAPIERIGIENPIMHRHALALIGQNFEHSIQPFEFGHPESKRTCLWLKNLPPLKPTKVLALPECGHWENQTPSGQNRLGPSPTRSQDRARTYSGIASAMAEQWGCL